MVSLPGSLDRMISTSEAVAGTSKHSVRDWVVDVALGSVVGALIGGIVAVNVVIFSGIDDGYQASIGDVFSDNPIIGVLTVAILVAGPFAGIVMMRRRRARRRERAPGSSDLRP